MQQLRYFLTAQRLLATPLIYFELKGTDKDDLLIKLRQARTLDAKGEARAHASIREDDLPAIPVLEDCLEDFLAITTFSQRRRPSTYANTLATHITSPTWRFTDGR